MKKLRETEYQTQVNKIKWRSIKPKLRSYKKNSFWIWFAKTVKGKNNSKWKIVGMVMQTRTIVVVETEVKIVEIKAVITVVSVKATKMIWNNKGNKKSTNGITDVQKCARCRK